MKFVIQRVTEASCTVDGNVTGALTQLQQQLFFQALP